MKGAENNIYKFMSGGERYLIPCYQRPYSWTEEQCRTLFDDMLHLLAQRQHDFEANHFIGSIVCQQVKGPQSGYFIIDGQQRLTTMYLFYLALYRICEKKSMLQAGSNDIAPSIKFKILTDSSSGGIGSLGKHRFELSADDQLAMDRLFADDVNEYVKDSKLTTNYLLFCQWIEELPQLNLSDLLEVTKRLVFIEINLDQGDNAQRIFESLNSTGVVLSKGDKVRNFLLMGFSQEVVKGYYRELWRPMEQNCHQELSEFIQYYLSIQYARAPSMKSLYLDFKDYVQHNGLGKIEVMEELLAYSKLFARINACSYELYADHDTDLAESERAELARAIELSLSGLKHLNYSVRIPFIMHCMRLHQLKEISGAELLAILKLIETFLLRRWVCNIPSQGLNRWFQALHEAIMRVDGAANFVGKLVELVCPEGKAILPNSMPTDATFTQALWQRDLYSESQNRERMFYLFERLENAGSREQVKIFEALAQKQDAYSLEHIMPQTLSPEWRTELGPDADTIHHTWLHRLANLTVTAYNSKYSNSSFAEKCAMDHGFASSPLRLNRDIAAFKHWGPEAMQQRAKTLIAKALTIWPYPRENSAIAAHPSEQQQVVLTEPVSAPKQGAGAENVLMPHDFSQQQTSLLPEQEQGASSTRLQATSNEPSLFDYCLADEFDDLRGTKPTGFELLGQHYEAKSWAQMQRQICAKICLHNPERLRQWLNEKWGNFNILMQFVKSSPDFSVAKTEPSSVAQMAEGIFLNSHQDVNTKIKLLQQLFDLMELDPHLLTLHLFRHKD